MNKEKTLAESVARYLVLVPFLATIAITACQEKKDIPLPSTKTNSVEEMVEGVDNSDIVVEGEKIPNVFVEEEGTSGVVIKEEEIPVIVVEK